MDLETLYEKAGWIHQKSYNCRFVIILVKQKKLYSKVSTASILFPLAEKQSIETTLKIIAKRDKNILFLLN